MCHAEAISSLWTTLCRGWGPTSLVVRCMLVCVGVWSKHLGPGFCPR